MASKAVERQVVIYIRVGRLIACVGWYSSEASSPTGAAMLLLVGGCRVSESETTCGVGNLELFKKRMRGCGGAYEGGVRGVVAGG